MTRTWHAAVVNARPPRQRSTGTSATPPSWQAQPLVTVGHAAECAPGGFILCLADGSKRLARGPEPVSNVPVPAERGVDEDEPEVWLTGVQPDATGDPVPVVVRVREDASKGSVARHDSNLSTGGRAWPKPALLGELSRRRVAPFRSEATPGQRDRRAGDERWGGGLPGRSARGCWPTGPGHTSGTGRRSR